MIASTHITFAGFVYLLLLTTTGVSLSILNTIVIGLASVLPDVDTGASFVGRALPFLSRRIERRFGHRTLTHSAPCIVGLAILLSPLMLFNKDIYVCVCIGYATHPFLDSMTVNGVKLFYPFSTSRCVFPLEVNNPHRYRIHTGSKTDKVLGIVFLLACVPTFFIAHRGYERFIRSVQQSIEAAVRDYNDFSRDHIVLADLKAYSMLTKEPLMGTVEIIGALNPQTLVFKGMDGHLHTLGKNFEADFVAENITCQRGRRSRSFVRTVDMNNQLMGNITAYMDSAAESYCFGNLTISDKVSLPENIGVFSPITGSGSTVKFNFATVNDIGDFNLENVFVTKGIVTIKSIAVDPDKDNRVGTTQPSQRKESYTQISCLLNANESLTMQKQRGDTLGKDDVMATKDLSRLFNEQINLNDDKQRAIENQQVTTLADMEQKIVNAEQAAKIDSVKYSQVLELSRSHFISPMLLETAELRWHKERRLFQQLLSARSMLLQKSSLELHKLNLSTLQLRSKAKAAERQSAIRSTVAGVLVDIRQTVFENKTRFTFIIKRLGE